MFALKWVKLMRKEGGQSLDGSFMKSLSLQALPLNQGGWVRFPSCTQKCQCVPDVRRNLPKIDSKIKIQTKKYHLNQWRTETYGGRNGFKSSTHEFDGQSHLSVAAHVCVRPLSSCGLCGFIQKEIGETSPGRQSAGRFRWLTSSVRLDG